MKWIFSFDFKNAVRARVAESIEEPTACVDIEFFQVRNHSVVAALGVAPHRCGEGLKCEARIIEQLHSRWDAAIHNPSSPLRLHFGSSVDTAFPLLLRKDSCASLGLSCVKGHISDGENSSAASFQRAHVDTDGGERHKKSKHEWKLWRKIPKKHRWWVTLFATSIITSCCGFFSIKGLRRVDSMLRRRAHTSEIKRDAEILAELGQVEIKLTEFGDRIEETCAICLGCFGTTEKLLLLPCGHLLHYDCVIQWLHLRLTCPVCRCPVALRECLVHAILPSMDETEQNNHSIDDRPGWPRCAGSDDESISRTGAPSSAESAGDQIDNGDEIPSVFLTRNCRSISDDTATTRFSAQTTQDSEWDEDSLSDMVAHLVHIALDMHDEDRCSDLTIPSEYETRPGQNPERIFHL